MDNEKIDFSTFLDVPSVRKVRSYILKWRGRMKIGESPSKETSEKHSASMKEVWKKKREEFDRTHKKLYTLADLEQARKQGAEDERGRCIDAVVEATHGGALRSAVDAIRALGPIGETREETERQVRQEWVDAARAYRELTVCYRVGKRPTEKLFAALRKADALLDAIAEGK